MPGVRKPAAPPAAQDDEPAPKRRSARQAAVAAAAAAEAEEQTMRLGKMSPAAIRAARMARQAAGRERGRQSDDKETAGEHGLVPVDGIGQGLDAIPAVNPEAPRHDGEWYWLMKAEPETRLENSVDVSFSIDGLRARTRPEGWDGEPRAPEALFPRRRIPWCSGRPPVAPVSARPF